MVSVNPRAEEPRRLEDRHIAGRDLDRDSRPGVAARPGVAVPDLERAEAPELDVVGARQRILHRFGEGVDHQPAGSLGNSRSDRIGGPLNEIRFRHPLLLARSAAKSRRFTMIALHGHAARSPLFELPVASPNSRPAGQAISRAAAPPLPSVRVPWNLSCRGVAIGRCRISRDDRATERRTGLLDGMPLPAVQRVIVGVTDSNLLRA